MENEYKKIINKKILNSYCAALVIDVNDDKIFKYLINNGEFVLDEQSSYVEYLGTCNNFIYEDDIQNYIDSLSISKLESDGNVVLNYRMQDSKIGGYRNYENTVSLYTEDGKKLIVVLVSEVNNSVTYDIDEKANDERNRKFNKLVDSVSLAILKIHNVLGNTANVQIKEEYINSILSALTVEFPEFNDAINHNANEIYSNGKQTIMIVDDDKMTCSLIKKIFDKDYDVIVANNGQEAIDILSNNMDNRNYISCIFLDLIMPVLDGFSVLDYLNDNNYLSKLPVIIISGNYDKETRNKAYSYQIADMLEKPFNVQVVRHRIENLINLYRSSGSLNEMMLEQHKDLKNIVNSIITSYEMDNATSMDMIKKYTRILTMQVSVQYPEYNINSNMIDKIANSSAYYSIGNYTLPKSLLYKKGLYTDEERSIVKASNINGAAIVKYVLSKDNTDIDSKYCYEIVKYHNERYDGNGYPEGLSSNSIPLSAQIASLAIEYSNLINTIVPVDYERVAELIIMESGRKFSPKIVEAFKKVQSEFEAITKVG